MGPIGVLIPLSEQKSDRISAEVLMSKAGGRVRAAVRAQLTPGNSHCSLPEP
jgi:hypothetical protein